MRIAMIAASAALASMSTTAYAADIYSKGGSFKDGPVAYEAPSPIWAGLYVGGSAGFGVGNTTGQLKFDEETLFSDEDGSINGEPSLHTARVVLSYRINPFHEALDGSK